MKPPPGDRTLANPFTRPTPAMPAPQPFAPTAPARRRPALRHALLGACLAWACGTGMASAAPPSSSAHGVVQVTPGPLPVEPGHGKAAPDTGRAVAHKAPAPTRTSLRAHRLQTWWHIGLAALAGGLFAWLVMALVRLARRPRGAGAPRRQDDASADAVAPGDDVSTGSRRSG